jgi:hypothetical protein
MNQTNAANLTSCRDGSASRPPALARTEMPVRLGLASYAQLRRDIHDALRAQHPEWILPNGDCPTCESYESRLAELLRLTERTTRGEAMEVL